MCLYMYLNVASKIYDTNIHDDKNEKICSNMHKNIQNNMQYMY